MATFKHVGESTGHMGYGLYGRGFMRRYMEEGYRSPRALASGNLTRPSHRGGSNVTGKSSSNRFARLDRLQAQAQRTQSKAAKTTKSALSRVTGAVKDGLKAMFRTFRKSG